MSESIDAANAWRTETPGHEGWDRTAQVNDAAKFFMVSADGHVQEPSDLWVTRMDESLRERLPGVIMDGKGNKFQKTLFHLFNSVQFISGFIPLTVKM